MATLVYQYGLKRPTQNADLVRDVIRAGHKLYNELISVQRGCRNRLREIERSADTIAQLAEAHAKAVCDLEVTLSVANKEKAKTRSRAVSPEHKAAIALARERKTTTQKAWAAERARVREAGELKQAKKDAGKLACALGNNAYAHSKLKETEGWGTRALIVDAIYAANNMSLYEEGEPNDPGFRRWAGAGRLGVSVNTMGASGAGLTVAEIHGDKHSFAGVTSPDAGNGSRRSGRRTTLRMRIGSDTTKKPIFAEWPMVMHRPFPDDAIIQYIEVSCRKVGPTEKWTVQFTLQTPDRARNTSGPTVAIDIGFRKVPGGLRVATWVDTDGKAGELVLSDAAPVKDEHGHHRYAGVLSGFAKADSLRSIRDKNFDEAREALSLRLSMLDCVPEWLSHEAKTIDQWKSQARLARLRRTWVTLDRDGNSRRFDGDSEALTALQAWAKQDRHLWQWESDQRQKSTLQRRDIVRNLAAQLSRTHGSLIVSNANYAKIKRRSAVEEATDIETVQHNQQLAAPGELRRLLERAFGLPPPSKKVPAKHRVEASALSYTCPACGSIDPSQYDAKEHDTVCAACPYVRDADTTAALNMLVITGHKESVLGIIERGHQFAKTMREIDNAAE